ncbi:MAG: phosphoglycolate phosphatase [Clostridia bacterium]|nr:phosphoglycolate phosphatase [Clostridia bacterium]
MEKQLEGRELELKVTDMMRELGVPAHLKGYHYVREGIIEAYNDMAVVSSVTKLLYPDIAKKFKTSDQKVERAIRNAIEVTWSKNCEYFKEFFGNSTWTNRPTNSEFIATFADKIEYSE